MKSIYYAHSVGLYGTKQEQRDISTLSLLGFTVINPNQPAYDEGYRQNGMEFFKNLVHDCGALAFRANPDGSINAGVFKEICWAEDKDIPVIELPSAMLRRTLSVAETRVYLSESGAR